MPLSLICYMPLSLISPDPAALLDTFLTFTKGEVLNTVKFRK